MCDYKMEMLKRGVWVRKIIPGLIFLSLWLDGWFFPLILLPILYVLLVEKRSLGWLGFWGHEFRSSTLFGVLISLILSIVYYPIFLYYLPIIGRQPIDLLYRVFTDVFWYPLYEEIAYRSFALTHFADQDSPCLSTRNLIVNLSQSLLFLSIHKHHVTSGKPLILVPVFLLGLLNGFLFLKTRNIYGCILSHSTLNSFALVLRYTLA